MTNPLADRITELRAELAGVDEELAAVRAARGDAAGDDEHDPEGSTLANDWSRLTGQRVDALARLADAERAADRMRSGSYGICERCGRPISAARLEALPAATLCIDCARGISVGRRQLGEA